MPRTLPGKKNQHNNRHENGLVGPGKRITKQKSNGHINGNPRGPVPDTPPLTPVAASEALMTHHSENDSNGSLPDTKTATSGLTRAGSLRKRDSDSSHDGQETYSNGLLQKGNDDSLQRRNDAISSWPKARYDANPFQLASTILRSCPAYDTIAILILLLQLPPIILTIVQALFASLTFMPVNGVSIGSMFTLFDVFQGSAGVPSLGTMLFVDVVCLGGWYCLWTWAQNFALDLAQVQVAITLGGGGAGKSGSVNSFCVAIVLVLHLIRSKGVRQFFFSHVLSVKIFANDHVAHLMQFVPHETDFGNKPFSPNWLQSLFAVHIISQAAIAMVRRRVASSQVPSASKSNKRADAEASAGAQPNQDSSNVESGASATPGPSIEHQSPSSPGLKDVKEKTVSAKKRRRHANQVRSRQPFWAALASTKVTVMREYEHTRGSSKVAGGQSEDPKESTTGGDELIWITQVEPSAIKFEASNIFIDAEDQECGDKPLYVRINGASWRAFSLSSISRPQPESDAVGQWIGEIYGLAPNCTYTCSFLRSDDEQEFSTIMVKTPELLEKDQTTSSIVPSVRQPLRPSSPITTIRTSIQTAEARLNDTRNRLTKARRSHKASLSKLEKEVDSLNARLQSSSDDTKSRQKLLQAERNIRQTEDATKSISTALDDLAVIPEEESEDWSTEKNAFDEKRDLLAAANESLELARSASSAELLSVSTELSTITSRRERLLNKQAKLSEQHDRITQANAQGLNEKERKAAETSAKEEEYRRCEVQAQTHFEIFNREIANLRSRTEQAWQEIQAYERQAQAQAQRELMLKNAGSVIPDGGLQGAHSPHSATVPRIFGFPSMSMAQPLTMSPETSRASPFLAYAKTLTPVENHFRRPRSASNRSAGAISNFSTDFEDADPIPPMPAVGDFDANRKGSGSSHGTNNGSPGAMAMVGLGSPMRGRGSPGHGIW